MFRSRDVSIRVEWDGDADEDAIIALLQKEGAWNVRVDADVDPEHVPCGGITHAHDVFRFCIGRDRSVCELLSAVAMHPSVCSVSE